MKESGEQNLFTLFFLPWNSWKLPRATPEGGGGGANVKRSTDNGNGISVTGGNKKRWNSLLLIDAISNSKHSQSIPTRPWMWHDSVQLRLHFIP